MKRFEITKNDADQRLDRFIQKVAGNLSPSLMYKYLRKKSIKVNGKKAEGNSRLAEGDIVEMYINDEFFTEKKSDFRSIAYQPNLSIVYEDENLMLVDKKAGVPVHADDHGSRDTLINHILLYLYQKGDYDPDAENTFTPALCNRLDKNTGGIVIVAKNAKAGRALYEIVKYRQVEKRYLALALGHFERKEATLKAWLKKDANQNMVQVSAQKKDGFKEIITRYRVLKEGSDLSLVEVELVTGRTHQIRAHLAFEGHPIAGDMKYGRVSENKKNPFRHQALYAYSLEFKLPADHFLSYLNGKVFQVPKVYFEDYI